MVTLDTQCARSKLNHQAWVEVASGKSNWDDILSSNREKHRGLVTTAPDPISLCAPDTTISSTFKFLEKNTRVFSCISDVTQWCESEIAQGSVNNDFSPSGGELAPDFTPNSQGAVVADGADDGDCHVQVLVTGSLHLVGATMNALGCRVEDL